MVQSSSCTQGGQKCGTSMWSRAGHANDEWNGTQPHTYVHPSVPNPTERTSRGGPCPLPAPPTAATQGPEPKGRLNGHMLHALPRTRKTIQKWSSLAGAAGHRHWRSQKTAHRPVTRPAAMHCRSWACGAGKERKERMRGQRRSEEGWSANLAAEGRNTGWPASMARLGRCTALHMPCTTALPG